MTIDSPPCTVWSSLQNLWKAMPGGEDGLQQVRRAAEQHLKFCCELYWHPNRSGFYFIHEHPETAASWKLPCMIRLMGTPGVMKTVIDSDVLVLFGLR